jgi:hypothetical protein
MAKIADAMQETCKHRIQRGNVKRRIGLAPLLRARRRVLALFLDCVDGLHRRPTLHCENDAELCLAAHHARERLGRLFERIGFNHGPHAAEFGEA